LKKVRYKVFLCENCQRQSCKAFIGLTNRAKMIGGRRRLLPEILDQSDCIEAKSPIFDLFARSDSAVTPSETRSRAITAFKVIQGHRGRYQSKAPMRFPISD